MTGGSASSVSQDVQPFVLAASDPAVRRLVADVAPGAHVRPLGGEMSLNLHLDSAGLVLRIHHRYVSRRRVQQLRRLRHVLAEAGLIVGEPYGDRLLSCRGRSAELERYVTHDDPLPTWSTSRWLFRALGELHRVTRDLDMVVSRPTVSTYGPPSTLRRCLPITEQAVRVDPEAADTIEFTRRLLALMRRQWVPATELPCQLIHGDVRLGNITKTPIGDTVYLDFGFAAHRPRIHDLAYALSWIILGPDGNGRADEFPYRQLPELLGEYEESAHTVLSPLERQALVPYTASVPMYLAAVAGWANEPTAELRDPGRQAFLRIAEWLLTNPTAALGSPVKVTGAGPTGLEGPARDRRPLGQSADFLTRPGTR